MGVFIKEIQSILIDSQYTRGHNGAVAAALDVEEGGAKHGEGTDQACVTKRRVIQVITEAHVRQSLLLTPKHEYYAQRNGH